MPIHNLFILERHAWRALGIGYWTLSVSLYRSIPNPRCPKSNEYMRILIVEDEEAIASVLKRGLEEAGYFVTIASDGKTGLELAQERSFHLVILDIMLPGLNGFAICRELREGMNPVPILMLTARDAV